MAATMLAGAGLAYGAPLLSAEPVEARSERDTDSVASGGARETPPDRLTATDVPNQSKTIQMLLEMQGKDPGLAGGERPRQEVPTSSRRAAGESNPQPAQPFGAVDAANPFGGATPQTQKAARPPTGDAAVDWTQLQPPRFGGGGMVSGGGAAPPEIQGGQGSRGGSSGASARDDARWLIPPSVVRFVRQHRELIVTGSVLLLLLIWGAAAMSARRRSK